MDQATAAKPYQVQFMRADRRPLDRLPRVLGAPCSRRHHRGHRRDDARHLHAAIPATRRPLGLQPSDVRDLEPGGRRRLGWSAQCLDPIPGDDACRLVPMGPNVTATSSSHPSIDSVIEGRRSGSHTWACVADSSRAFPAAPSFQDAFNDGRHHHSATDPQGTDPGRTGSQSLLND